jgi:hypothetical protein
VVSIRPFDVFASELNALVELKPEGKVSDVGFLLAYFEDWRNSRKKPLSPSAYLMPKSSMFLRPGKQSLCYNWPLLEVWYDPGHLF